MLHPISFLSKPYKFMNHQRLILCGYLRPRRPSRHDHHRYHTTSIVSSINWVRDRALDHAVEKERDLKPMINIKNLLISEPSKSLPVSIISDKKTSLSMSAITRPIEFIRKYPSVFQEYFPGGIGSVHPHVKLTQETLDLHSEEDHFFDTHEQKLDVANRLLKLLMLARVNKLPLCVIDRLKWDLGLPNDYINAIVPCFPDYFQVNSKGNELELVCWNNELAVSVMDERKSSSFSLQYSRGFEMDNKFKKWVDDWQKLPYVSPYENVLGGKSDEESDKWIVGLLHEILNIMVPKKTEKDNLLDLGECLGVRSRFKKALLEHPGIFYVSSKLHTHTVVLREGYKRDLLVDKPVHPLMSLRSAYIHLMNMVKRDEKNKSQENAGADETKGSDEEGEEDEDEWSESESEDEQDDDDSELEDVGDSEKENSVADGRGKVNDDDTRIRGRPSRTVKSTMKFNDSPRRNTPNARSSENDGRRRGRGRERTRKNVLTEKTDSRSNRGTSRTSDSRTNQRSDRRTNQMSDRYEGTRSDGRTNKMSDRKETHGRTREGRLNGPKVVRTEAPGGRKDFGRVSNRPGASRTRERRF